MIYRLPPMTVADLIAKLATMPQTAIVLMDHYWPDPGEITAVILTEDGVELSNRLDID